MISPLVTGVGVASAAGLDLESYWQSLVSCADVFSDYVKRPGSGIRIAGIEDAGQFKDLPIAVPAMCDRSTFLAVFAARAALKEAGLQTPFENPTRVAVVIGNGGGGLDTLDQQYERFHKHDKRPHPFSVVRIMVSASASWLSIAFGAKGPCFVVSSACASATQAIGTAASLLKAGLCDVAITGGTEAPLTIGNILAWDAMKVMSHRYCRPFSRTRDGMMLSEGAGILILETPEHARRRGFTGQVALSGFASNSDAGDIVSPSSDGMLQVMKAALQDANLHPQQVSYINAHGTGTASNDIAEVKALKALFGSSPVPPTSSIKGVTGHSLGAAGALEAVATVLAIRKSIAPPTAHFEEVDPDCDIDVIPNQARSIPIDVALSNSFAFGGLNAALVFQRVN